MSIRVNSTLIDLVQISTRSIKQTLALKLILKTDGVNPSVEHFCLDHLMVNLDISNVSASLMSQ